MEEKQNIKIEGYNGKWSAIASYNGEYYLMEHNYYGDETNYLVIDKNDKVICETYDDIETALEDEGIL